MMGKQQIRGRNQKLIMNERQKDEQRRSKNIHLKLYAELFEKHQKRERTRRKNNGKDERN